MIPADNHCLQGKRLFLFPALLVLLLLPACVTFCMAEPDTVKIGVVMPLTGVRADCGHYAVNALQIAAQDLAARPSGQFRIEFVIEDSRYEPAQAVTALNKLIEVDKVRFVIGGGGSSETLAMAPIAERRKVILLTPSSQADEISNFGDYIFRMIHNSAQEAPFFAAFVAYQTKSDILHFLCMKTAASPSYLAHFRPTFERLGKRIGLIEEFDTKDSDFRPQLLRVKAKSPTDIFLLAPPSQMPLILAQAKQMGIRAQLYSIGAESPEMLKAPDNSADGLFYAYSYDSASGDKEVRRFRDAYFQLFGEEPDTVAANTYDIVSLLSSCFEHAGIVSDKVRDCLYATKGYNGASGIFNIDKNGDAIKPLMVKTIRNGKFVRYDDSAQLQMSPTATSAPASMR